MADSHPCLAAAYDLVVPERTLFADHRAYLVEGLSGRVLDLGAGTGATFPHVAGTVDRGVLELHAIEPDPHMRRRAERRAADLDLAVELRDGRAESLPYPADTFDVVLASLVFCTIADPDAAMAEVARVVKAGGEFRFFEHVHADGAVGTGTRLVNPLWRRLAGGCNLDRRSVERFVGHGGFDVLEIERAEMALPSPVPFVRGRLERRRPTGLGR